MKCFPIYKSICIPKIDSLRSSIRWDKIQANATKIIGQKKLYKKCTLFSFATFFLFSCHNFTFILWLLYELKHKVASFKSVCRILQFRFCFVFIKVYFFKQKAWTLWLIIPFKIKIVEKLYTRLKSCTRVWKVVHALAPSTLIFKLQQEVLKFSDICVCRSSPKTDVEMNFSNLENRSFENVSFSWGYAQGKHTVK